MTTMSSKKNGSNQSIGEIDADSEINCVSHVIGEFGPWQQRFYFYFCFLYFLNVFHNFGNVFYGARSDYWCRDKVHSNMTSGEWDLIKNKCFDDCSGYDTDKTKYYRTIFSEFELVCNRRWLVSIASSTYQIGYLISSVTVSYFSDRFGRKPIFKTVMIIDVLACFLQAFAPNIYFYLFAQILVGITSYGKFLTGVLLIMETAGSKTKSKLMIAVEFFWAAGVFIFLALFYYLPDFRYLKLITGIYEMLFMIRFDLVPESIRWLLSKGKYEEAKQLLLTASDYNRLNSKSKINLNVPVNELINNDQGKQTTELKIKLLIEHFNQQELSLAQQRKKNIFDLWTSSILPICLILYFCWFTNQLINYGTSYNLSNFGSNLILSSIMFELAVVSSCVISFLIIERINRRIFIRCAYLLTFLWSAGLALSFYLEGLKRGSLIRLILPSDPSDPLRIVLGMLLKLTGNFGYHVVYLMSVESFPTLMRQLGVGTCSLVSRIASISAPFMHELGILIGIPSIFALFATCALIALILVGFMPETRGKEIPNTLDECCQRQKQTKEAKLKNKS